MEKGIFQDDEYQPTARRRQPQFSSKRLVNLERGHSGTVIVAASHSSHSGWVFEVDGVSEKT